MPQAPRPCPGIPGHPPCPNLTTGGRCPNCRATGHRRADANRPTPRARGYDAEWERTRSAYLAEHPRCEEPGCPHPSTDVDHIDGAGPLGPRGHDWSNLQALCHSHHSQKTARQDGAFGRTRGTTAQP